MKRLSAAAASAALALLCLALPPSCTAQPQHGGAQSDRPIDAATRTQVIDSVLKRLNDSYVFPEVAKKMEESVRARLAAGGYETITSARKFAETLMTDLQAVSKDKHLRVRYSHEPLPARGPGREPTAEEREGERRTLNWMNHGFNKVERLPGNTGYIEFRGFFDAEAGAETVANAMSFVADTDALIIDLRNNGGGNPEMVALICSYFFGPDPVHLNDLYWREGNRTDQFWTRKEVAGKRYLNKDVYVLTSNYTFSGAEEFAYNLKSLKRATIVGETTGGGAHPGGPVRVHEHFSLNVPRGRAINPITKTNWEGTGVKPDIEVPAAKALKTARLMALKKSVGTAPGPQFKLGVQEEIDELERELNEPKDKK